MIADGGQVSRLTDHCPDQSVLDWIDVLDLIDDQPSPGAGETLEEGRFLLEPSNRFGLDCAEVQKAPRS